MINTTETPTAISRRQVSLPGVGHIISQESANLWNSLCDPNMLRLAWLRVRQNRGRPGIDGMSIQKFECYIERNLSLIQMHLGHYQPLPYLRIHIHGGNGRTRALDIPCVRDRIVLRTLLDVLTPVVERHLHPCAFGYRSGRGAQEAVRHAQQCIREGKLWVFRSDITDFFGSMERTRLLEHLATLIYDEKILCLISKFLNAPVKADSRITFPARGIAQGSCLSPLLSNVYLRLFDVAMHEAGYKMIRYADDLLVLAATSSEAQRASTIVCNLLADYGLSLNSAKTVITSVNNGLEFLGFLIDAKGAQPGKAAVARLNERTSGIEQQNEVPLPDQVSRLRQVIRGWLNYFGAYARIPLDGCISSSVLTQIQLEMQSKIEAWSMPAELKNELSAYFRARERMEAATDELNRIEARLATDWGNALAALPHLRGILCHA